MNRYSELSQTLTDSNGVKYKSGLPFVDFLYEGAVAFHRVQSNEAGRLDLIAYQWYQDVSLYWVIALFNNIKDPLTEVKVGDDLAIPKGPITTRNFVPRTYGGTK